MRRRFRYQQEIMEAVARGGAGVSAPTNSVAPVISGNQQVTQTLTTTDGTWTGSPTFTYQWKRAGASIGSATNNTYVLVVADAGQAITCVVTGTNAGGNASATSNTLTTDVYAVLTAHPVDATDQTIYTYSSASLGTVAANRIIIIATFGGNGVVNSAAISTVTVAGASATKIIEKLTDASSNRGASIWAVSDTANASGNVVVTFGVGQTRCGISVIAMYGASGVAASASGSATITTGTNNASVALTVPAKGVGIAGAHGVAATATATWDAPYAEAVDEVLEGTLTQTSAILNSNAGGSITAKVTYSSNTTADSPLANAVWGP